MINEEKENELRRTGRADWGVKDRARWNIDIEGFPKRGKRFEEVWKKIDEKISAGEYISTDECYNEFAKHYSDKTDQYQWFHGHKDMFKNPNNKESIIISQLLMNPKMRETVHQKNILENRPSADVYIAAKAKALNATVVTNENYKPHSAQLPNLCEELGVSCISYDDFMEIIDELLG